MAEDPADKGVGYVPLFDDTEGFVQVDVAIMAGLFGDLVAIIHQLAPRQMAQLLSVRQERLRQLEAGERQEEMDDQLAGEQWAVAILAAALSGARMSPTRQ